MDQNLFKFDLIAEDPTTHARAGVLHTPHGDIETPIFMPVGTKANVKGIPTETVKQLGAQIVSPMVMSPMPDMAMMLPAVASVMGFLPSPSNSYMETALAFLAGASGSW